MRDLILRFARRLRFPWLFLLTALLFAIDLVVPDLIPFADEILLGLLTLLFGMWRRHRQERIAAGAGAPASPPVFSRQPSASSSQRGRESRE